MAVVFYTKEDVDSIIDKEVIPLKEQLEQLQQKLNQTPEVGFLTTKKICDCIGITRTTLRDWRDRFELKSYKPAGSNGVELWKIVEVIEFIESRVT
ncbi:helix-turn-helix transcriptional regulator [Microscilla marina]|uniref:Uncharacterized protein n=1 Tax=Microscilla marina ATCC 23134 TaxID=313606 RepID=A1ZU76_MICM2|nr:helix-turn-helix domain-containing protein [Microscilla marina]EAY26047.1 hypothetical protein M23134_06396 [Microscilla marina ATCC 23134]